MDVRSRQNVEHYQWGDACDGWRLLTHRELAVIEERIPPGKGEVAHFHSKARQLFYVLQGALSVELPEETLTVEAGECVEVAPGTVHRVHNPFAVDARFLVISAPTTTGDRTNVVDARP